jgi:hypothetical protein
MKPTSFSFNGSLTNNRCTGFFVDEIRQATLLALVFSIAVLLTTGCSSTGDGFSAKFIAPVTSSAKGSAPEDNGYYPARSPAFDDLIGR